MTLVLGSVSKKPRWHVVLLAARIKKKALGTPGAEQVPVVGWVARQVGLCRCLSFLPIVKGSL